jgi:O-acetyl-ADP-ribose deacetylase (regulator of RNase III)
MNVDIILVDVNPKMVAAWRTTFENNPEVQVIHGSMLEVPASAWVSPTNSHGQMDGGLDAILKGHFGAKIEKRLQQEIAKHYGGVLPVGHATCVETGSAVPRYLISTPTMMTSSEDISDTLNVALACAAAFQVIHMQNAKSPGSIRTVALPGLGANTGKVPVEICADLMWTGYSLFRSTPFPTFGAMRVALEGQLGNLGRPQGPSKKSSPSAKPQTKPQTGNGPSQPKPPPADFDDFG